MNECRGGALYKYPGRREVKAMFRGIAILAVVAVAAIRVAALWASFL